MNEWKKIWDSRPSSISKEDDIFSIFTELKKANGFDVNTTEGFYESFYQEWENIERNISGMIDTYSSVYEVGCGSGVNLFLFMKLKNINLVGGIDYSRNLVTLANSIISHNDTNGIIEVGEAREITEEPKYDVVISESVFQYFQDDSYGYEVLCKMYEKATKAVVITEIYDKDKKEDHITYKKKVIPNYEERYRNLDKTYYYKKMFKDFAKERGCKCIIKTPTNGRYYNNDYVFDCYLIKNDYNM